MKSNKRSGEKKGIETIIREMVYEVRRARRIPCRITLTEEHYRELQDKNKLYDESGYKFQGTDITYFPNRIYKSIDTYIGLPVYRGKDTKISFV